MVVVFAGTAAPLLFASVTGTGQDTENGQVSLDNWIPFVTKGVYRNQAAAVLIFLVWLKWFKYFHWVPSLRVLASTLGGAGARLFSFLVLFLTLHFAATVAFYVLFSSKLAEYRSIPKTCFTLFRLLTGDFDYSFDGFADHPDATMANVMATGFGIVMVFIMLTGG